ncbi:MAG: hypothetical protein R3D05_08705 [Dongiaceae bacterium]
MNIKNLSGTGIIEHQINPGRRDGFQPIAQQQLRDASMPARRPSRLLRLTMRIATAMGRLARATD